MSYTIEGSYVAEPCPLGTYSNVSGAVNNYECFDCDAGYYCSSVAGGAPTGACWGGYYCTGAAKTPIQHITDPGNLVAFICEKHDLLYSVKTKIARLKSDFSKN